MDRNIDNHPQDKYVVIVVGRVLKTNVSIREAEHDIDQNNGAHFVEDLQTLHDRNLIGLHLKKIDELEGREDEQTPHLYKEILLGVDCN